MIFFFFRMRYQSGRQLVVDEQEYRGMKKNTIFFFCFRQNNFSVLFHSICFSSIIQIKFLTKKLDVSVQQHKLLLKSFIPCIGVYR